MSTKKRNLGRPPDSDSGETRQRILDTARTSFAETGFTATTNGYIASKAGITTGALYHYFDSKVDLFQAAYTEAERLIYERFSQALTTEASFTDRLKAILETAHELNKQDPSLAKFIGAARVDLSRLDELRAAAGTPGMYGTSFFNGLIKDAVDAGEIRPERQEMVAAFVRTVIVGLTDAVSDDIQSHRMAVDAVGAVLDGVLFDGMVGNTSSTAGSIGRATGKTIGKATGKTIGKATGKTIGKATAKTPSAKTAKKTKVSKGSTKKK
jgi:AcrR family transcriptional regulator